MSSCSSCGVELVEGTNWSAKGGHKFCRSCFREKYNKSRMFLNGKYIPKSSSIYKPGVYKSLDDAWSHTELDTKDVSGEIYIMVNKSFKGWVKVGMSIDAIDRLSNYQTGDPHRAYQLYATFEADDRHQTERQIHEILAGMFKKQNEWFKASPEIVEEVMSKYFGERDENRKDSAN